MELLTPEQVPELLPGAPVPAAPHVTIALAWGAQQLLVRGLTIANLTAEQVVLYRTAVAARSLSLKAAIEGTVAVSATSNARVIEQIKIPEEIEVKWKVAAATDQPLYLAADQWAEMALSFLMLALPGLARRRAFAGTSR